MSVKLLLISGFGMRANNWADEAEHVRRTVPWIDAVMINTGNPLGSYEQRAAEIMAQIGSRVGPDDQLIIIAHSFGGIVARYMASQRMLNPAVIVTIATPHYGVQHADMVQQIIKTLQVIGLLVKGGYALLTRLMGTNSRAMEQLTTACMLAFNEAHPNRPDVVYQSYGSVAEKVSWWLRLPFALLTAYAGVPNDGLIALPSMQWGTFMGIVTCDHNEAIGWSGPNHFDAAQFVVDILEKAREHVQPGENEAERG